MIQESAEEDKLKIDINKIQNQVRNAVLAEEKYWRENDAKLRAVEQRVATYDDFRQMVLASHLRPLDKGESLAKNFSNKTTWNPTLTAASLNQQNSDSLNNKQTASKLTITTTKQISTSLEFKKIWSSFNSNSSHSATDDKWTFLQSLGCEQIKQIFKSEIDGYLMGEFIVLFELELKKRYQQQDNSEQPDADVSRAYIIELLSTFRDCNRFNLNKMFLKSNELNSLKNVFEILKKSSNNNDEQELIKLEKSYF